MALFLLFILLAVILGFIGVLVKGLVYLLVIGIVIFVLDLLFAGRLVRGRRRRVTR